MFNSMKMAIYQNMNSKNPEELLKIWSVHNKEKWSDEAFKVIGKILIEGGEKLPKRREAQMAMDVPDFSQVSSLKVSRQEMEIWRR